LKTVIEIAAPMDGDGINDGLSHKSKVEVDTRYIKPGTVKDRSYVPGG